MTNRTTIMMGLYLVVIAMGAAMMQSNPLLGLAQICIGALFFALRLQQIMGRKP